MGLKNRLALLAALLSVPLLAIVSLSVGSYPIGPDAVLSIISDILQGQRLSVEQTIVLDIRLPRIVMAVLVGAALSLASACYQSSFRNPLVSEYILGVSAGAAFGASLSLAFWGSGFPVQPAAFVGGLAAVAMTYGMARIRGEVETLSLVLAGIITTALFTGANYLIRYVVDPERLHTIVVWVMGSFAGASWQDVRFSGALTIAGAFCLFLVRWRLNLLSMGDEEARSLGLDVERFKLFVITAATLITSAAISTVGIVGWVGLIVPHVARLVVGSDNRILFPVSGAIGAVIMLTADMVIRSARGAELPIGVLTTMIGAPFFAWLLRRSGGRSWA